MKTSRVGAVLLCVCGTVSHESVDPATNQFTFKWL